MTLQTSSLIVPNPIKLLIYTLIVLVVAVEAIAVTSCESLTMTNNNPVANQNSNLPPTVAKAVLNDVSQKNQIPLSKLAITQAKREMWSNGCLGLAQEGEFCTQAIVPGWRVFISGNDQIWIYRTDGQGRVLRVEP